jgi:hypothetical protein
MECLLLNCLRHSEQLLIGAGAQHKCKVRDPHRNVQLYTLFGPGMHFVDTISGEVYAVDHKV